MPCYYDRPDENQKAFRQKIQTLHEMNYMITIADIRLGNKPSTTVNIQEIKDAFNRDYDPNATGFFAGIGNSLAVDTAENKIKTAMLACYRKLSEKQTQLIVKNQELLVELRKTLATKEQKYEKTRRELKQLAADLKSISSLLIEVENRKRGA